MKVKIDTSEIRHKGDGKTRVVSFLKNKGGVGCSTNAYNFACWLAREGYRVLLMDGDGQGDSTVLCRQTPEPGMYNLLVNNYEFDDVWRGVPGAIYGNTNGTLFVVPSNESSAKDIGERLANETISLRLGELEGRFDVVVIDTSPSASELHGQLYIASDYIVYPTQCQFEPCMALMRSMGYYQVAIEHGKSRARLLGILPAMFKRRSNLHHQYKGWLQGKYGDLVLNELRDLDPWRQAAAARTPIFIYEPSSDAAKEAAGVYRGFEAVMYG